MNSDFFYMFDITSIAVLVATIISVFSLIYAVVIPSLGNNDLEKRMQYIASEKEILRKQQRMRLENPGLRTHDNHSLRQFVKKLNLKNILVDEQIINKLRAAGFRSEYALNILLLVRFIAPIVCFIFGLIWVFGYDKLLDYPFSIRFIVSICIGSIGFYAPSIFINNLMQKRQSLIRSSWPDALDLLLICVESGISIDHAFRRVAEEVGGQSAALSEEMLLTTAELSFLPSRQMAFENLYNRTQMDCIRNVIQALIQADRYGTSIGDSLRILVEENRVERMTEAEKKAASLAPKLTVPMILFFLPVLLMVILGPAVLNIIDGLSHK